jgi:hypothetical protein
MFAHYFGGTCNFHLQGRRMIVKIAAFSGIILVITFRRELLWRSDGADVKTCYLVDIQQHFIVPPCLHLQSKR